MDTYYKHKTKEYVIAFIDILGAKQKIKQDVDESLNIVHNAYTEAIDFLDALYSGKIDVFRPQVKIFSDNIVVAVPTDIKDRTAALMSVMIYAGLIQHQFLHNKYLVRGGITLGEFFIDDVMLWGTALTRAYEIESTVAIYPRIVLDPNLVGAVKLFENKLLQKWVSQDVDSLLFINYMQERTMKEKNSFYPLLLYRIEEAEKMLIDAEGNLKAQQKVLWHLNYLQDCLKSSKNTDKI